MLAALTAGGCAADSNASTGPAPTPIDGRLVDIDAGALVFEPVILEVEAGELIVLSLRSTDIEHDLTVDEADFQLSVAAGETNRAALTIDAPGTYVAYCSVPGHRAAGMEMTVTVTDRS